MKENSLIYINNCRVQDLHGTKISSLDWEMRAGEAWLVIGPNGGGKADFLRALAGEKQILPNDSTGDYSTHFTDSVEIVSLERAASRFCRMIPRATIQLILLILSKLSLWSGLRA